MIALSVITMLMIIQLRSFTLGLLSLIPNVLPIACIFGLMAWLGISLNSMTIFAATAAIGLAVDDTIHYLTQLRRELSGPERKHNIEKSLKKAYETTARALISTSVVLFFGFLTLLLSPFRPLASFGVLLSSGILVALIGDLVVMPAVILSFPWIKRTLEEQMSSGS
jgi:predicted RND superfamily exporter protein